MQCFTDMLWRHVTLAFTFTTRSCAADRSEATYSLTYTEGLPMYRSDSSGAERLLEFGTTCTVAVLQQGRLLIGNTGDSGAVLGRWIAA